jgi:hypothetical protein
MFYCPNCSGELDSKLVGSCWNCQATFDGPEGTWLPVDNPPGEFRPQGKGLPPNIKISPAGRFILRLAAGFVIWIVLGFIAIGSAIPYGGGSKMLFGVWLLSTVVLLFWALMALVDND